MTKQHASLMAILGISLACLAGVTLWYNTSRAPSPNNQPNIVLIVSDDQRFDTMNAMPKLQAFMENGTTFPLAYVTTPLCCPSRSSILTGLYAHNHGVLGNRTPYGFPAFKDSSTLATWLKESGYQTALIGKYLNDYTSSDAHYLPPGWDTFQAFVDKPGYNDFTLTNFINGQWTESKTYTKERGAYSTHVLTAFAQTFLTNAAKNPAPFFLMFTPFAPHDPSTPPPEYQSTTKNTFPDLPSYNETNVSDKGSWTKTLPELTAQEEKQIDRSQRNTYGSLQALDDDIQKIIETLRATNTLNNTVIFYIGDNGVHWGEHRIANGKNTPYEESVRVPFMMYDGRNPQAATDERLVLNIDLAPTIAEIAGATPPSTIDGRSLFSTEPWRDYFLTECWGGEDAPPFTAMHTKDFSFIRFEGNQNEFYDLSQDPYQLTNLINNPAYQATVQDMNAKLNATEACSGNECP